MRRLWAICRKELQMYFFSPVSYVAFAIYFVIEGYMFSNQFTTMQIVDVRIIFSNMSMIFLFIVPLLTMRLISDELRHGTDELLMTSPANLAEIVFGKYLSSIIVLFALIGGSLMYPAILGRFGDLDMPVLWMSYVSVFLLGASMMAVGLFASSLTIHQMVAGIVSFASLLLLSMIGMLGNSMLTDWKDTLGLFSLIERLGKFQVGVLSIPDLLFYVSFSLLFVVLTILVLERKRLR